MRGAAERAIDRAEIDVQSLNNDVRRNQAAAEAATEMHTKVLEKLELDPFSPLAPDADIDVFDDTKIIQLARTVWIGSLSTADIASIGQTQNTNPFQFRKLVFWATAENLDLNQYAGEIDSVIDNMVQVATNAREVQKPAESRARTASQGAGERLGHHRRRTGRPVQGPDPNVRSGCSLTNRWR